VLLAAGLALAPGLLWAGTPIERTLALPEDGRVTVINVAGEIVVEGWSQPSVELTGELGDDSELEIRETDGGLRIEVKTESGGGWGRGFEGSDLYLRVPRGASLSLTGVSADLSVADMGGPRIEAESVSGDIEVEAETVELDLTSVSGDIDFRGAAERSSVESVSGDIELSGISGDLDASLVSGDVELDGGRLSRGHFESVSGTLELSLDLEPGGRLTVESMSGDVELALPGDQAADFDAQTFSGDIRSAFGEPVSQDRGPGSRLRHRVGDSGASVRIETFSGDIQIGHR
jgi:DUF4097 and DUF4098 domain-containing protein YvlB